MRWDRVDPRECNDGVLYLPAMVELQPRLPQWGHPEDPGLRNRVARDRPHGIVGGKLLCLLCMRIRAERGDPPAPVWMTFVEGPRRPTFRHEDGRSPHPEHQPETDEHKAIKERKARTWQTAGASEVIVEAWRPRARRRPDVLAVGPDLTVAGEVQQSTEATRVIQNRQRALVKAGDRVVWTTGRAADEISFLHPVPHLVIPALGNHRLYLHESRLDIVSGVTLFERQRCGWSDMWSGTDRCPVTGRAMPCGGWHLYPTLNPGAYRPDSDGRFPCGPRPHLDHLLEGVLRGLWLPYQHRRRITWVPSDVYEQVVGDRGGGVEQAETAAPRQQGRTSERTCERRLDDAPLRLLPPGPTPEQLASTVCLTCRAATAHRDRAGLRRCESCCEWLGVS